jgi:hypothetical protein
MLFQRDQCNHEQVFWSCSVKLILRWCWYWLLNCTLRLISRRGKSLVLCGRYDTVWPLAGSTSRCKEPLLFHIPTSYPQLLLCCLMIVHPHASWRAALCTFVLVYIVWGCHFARLVAVSLPTSLCTFCRILPLRSTRRLITSPPSTVRHVYIFQFSSLPVWPFYSHS